MPLKLLNWNVEWAAAKWKADEMQRRIDQHVADIICLTETDTTRLALPEDGHSICGQDNWGQPFRKGQKGRRKVLLWSRAPWEPRGCCRPRSTTARTICVRRHPDRRWRGEGHRRLHSLVPLARGSTLEPEDVAGPRGVSGLVSPDC